MVGQLIKRGFNCLCPCVKNAREHTNILNWTKLWKYFTMQELPLQIAKTHSFFFFFFTSKQLAPEIQTVRYLIFLFHGSSGHWVAMLSCKEEHKPFLKVLNNTLHIGLQEEHRFWAESRDMIVWSMINDQWST